LQGVRGASFVANVVLTQHKNAAVRLKGLAKLAQAGREISQPGYDIDTLWIDGYTYSWADVELVARGKKSAEA
jgi:hypothetical protein